MRESGGTGHTEYWFGSYDHELTIFWVFWPTARLRRGALRPYVARTIATIPMIPRKAAMPTRITKSFTLDAAHWLPEVPEGHKCGRLHGHTYTIILGLEGELDARLGWIRDYGEVSKAFAPVYEAFDHHCLNDIPGLENPTAEVMATWIFNKMKDLLPELSDVTVCETPTTSAVYRP